MRAISVAQEVVVTSLEVRRGLERTVIGRGRASEVGTELDVPRTAAPEIERADQKVVAKGVDDGGRRGTSQVVDEAFGDGFIQTAALAIDVGRSATAPTNGAGRGLARTALVGATRHAIHVGLT